MALTKHTGSCLAALALIAGLSLAGCGGGSSGSDNASDTPIINSSSNGGGTSSSSSSSSSSSGGEESSSSSSSGSSSGGSSVPDIAFSVQNKVGWFGYRGDISLRSGADLVYKPSYFKPTVGYELAYFINNYFDVEPTTLYDDEHPCFSEVGYTVYSGPPYALFTSVGRLCGGITGPDLWTFTPDFQTPTYPYGVTALMRVAGTSANSNVMDLDLSMAPNNSRIKLRILPDGLMLEKYDGIHDAIAKMDIANNAVNVNQFHIYQVSITYTAQGQGYIRVYKDAGETPALSVGDVEQPITFRLPGSTQNDPRLTWIWHQLHSTYLAFGNLSDTALEYNSALHFVLWTLEGAYTPSQLKGKLPSMAWPYPTADDDIHQNGY